MPGVGGNPGKPFVGVFTGAHKPFEPERRPRSAVSRKNVCTVDGLKTIDADAPLGVPAVTALADEMSAKNPLIKVTYENALNGVVMPNVPQMGKVLEFDESGVRDFHKRRGYP